MQSNLAITLQFQFHLTNISRKNGLERGSKLRGLGGCRVCGEVFRAEWLGGGQEQGGM